jgi:hypothetical protein
MPMTQKFWLTRRVQAEHYQQDAIGNVLRWQNFIFGILEEPLESDGLVLQVRMRTVAACQDFSVLLRSSCAL